MKYVMEMSQWSTHFPPGYRERLAPGRLGEVYSTGMALKGWAKNWPRERKTAESKDAREILPAMVALDSIFLHDQTRGAINPVSVERSARKAYGIVAGYRHVHCENDWKRNPSNKSWKSRVDYETWKWTDPSMAGKDNILVSREVEDEQRKEMDRDAQLIKAKSKLVEASGKSVHAGE